MVRCASLCIELLGMSLVPGTVMTNSTPTGIFGGAAARSAIADVIKLHFAMNRPIDGSPMNAPTEFARAVCPHDCPDTCAMRVTIENGRAIKVVGDPDHPPTQGALCTKVSRYAERVHHPRRLTTPMRRVGRKRRGSF